MKLNEWRGWFVLALGDWWFVLILVLHTILLRILDTKFNRHPTNLTTKRQLKAILITTCSFDHSTQKSSYAHLYLVYVNLHFDKYDGRMMKPDDDRIDIERIFYKNIFDLYVSRLNSAENNAMSLMNLVKKYEVQREKLIERTKRTFIAAFTYWSSDPSSRYYHSHFKHTLIKHNPWCGQVCNAWDGPIVNPETGQNTDNKELYIVKTT